MLALKCALAALLGRAALAVIPDLVHATAEFLIFVVNAIVSPFATAHALVGAVLHGMWPVFATGLALIQASTLALTALIVGLLGGLLVGFLLGFLKGSWWGWLVYIDQLYAACIGLTRVLRPRIDAAMDAAVNSTDVTRRFVEILNVMPKPKTGIDFVRYFTGPMTMARALQHPDAVVALSYGMGREQVAVMETRLVLRIYVAQLHIAWATAWGDAARAKDVYDEAVIWMRVLHELIVIRREARAMRATSPPDADHRHADALARPYLSLKKTL